MDDTPSATTVCEPGCSSGVTRGAQGLAGTSFKQEHLSAIRADAPEGWPLRSSRRKLSGRRWSTPPGICCDPRGLPALRSRRMRIDRRTWSTGSRASRALSRSGDALRTHAPSPRDASPFAAAVRVRTRLSSVHRILRICQTLAQPWLAQLALRLAQAVPFWKSGILKWRGFLHLNDTAIDLFTQEFRLPLPD